MPMSSSTPTPGGGPEPAPSLAGLSLSSRISAAGGGGGGRAPSWCGGALSWCRGSDASGPPELPLPAVGARVRCKGLTDAAELNGCLGRVESHDGARAMVVMDGPGGRVVGVEPQNLVVVLGLSDVLQVSGLFAAEVLSRLDPTDLALLRRVDCACRVAVESSDLPRAGVSEEELLEVSQFVGSVERLAWAKANGCPWQDLVDIARHVMQHD